MRAALRKSRLSSENPSWLAIFYYCLSKNCWNKWSIWEPLLIYFKLWSHVMSEICSFLVKKKMKRLLVIALIIFVPFKYIFVHMRQKKTFKVLSFVWCKNIVCYDLALQEDTMTKRAKKIYKRKLLYHLFLKKSHLYIPFFPLCFETTSDMISFRGETRRSNDCLFFKFLISTIFSILYALLLQKHIQ
jgi:hypothetical protein